MPLRRRRAPFSQTDEFTRGIIVGLRTAGWSLRRIAAHTHRDPTTIGRIWRYWCREGDANRRRGTGATRHTTERTERRIRRQAVADPHCTTVDIQRSLRDALDVPICRRTISNRLAEAGLHSCRPMRCLPLTARHRRHRLDWCRSRSHWDAEWRRVVFTDESRFCMSTDDRRGRVWRHRAERANPSAIVQRHTAPVRGVMVWGAISFTDRSALVRITGSLTAVRYVQNVLQPVAIPYVQSIANGIFQQDNARPHTAHISLNALQGVDVLPWPAYSPDLSPIEHLWDAIGRRISTLPQARNVDELWSQIDSTWSAIPQDFIQTLIASMPRRVHQCIAQRGGPTSY